MKKIMFNDRFGLTDAVLEGRKTVTRRIVTPQPTYSEMSGINWKGYAYGIGSNNPTDAYRNFITGTEYSKSCNRYRVGEVVAIAQRYEDIISGARFDNWEIKELQSSAGSTNKMFVKAYLMPHQIEMLDITVERLQDITEEDCLREGVKIGKCGNEQNWMAAYYIPNENQPYTSPREAFASLIDKISGIGTWESNPYVFRNEFKLIK